MNGDPEFAELETLWRADSAGIGPDALRRVRRESLRMRLVAVVEAVMLLGIGGWIVAQTLAQPSPVIVASAVVTLAFLAVAGVVGFLMRRGLWGADGADTLALLDLSIRRARHFIRATRIAMALTLPATLAGLVFGNAVGRRLAGETPASGMPAVSLVELLLACLVAGLVIGVSWYLVARKARELAQLEAIRRELAESTEDPEEKIP